MLGRLGHLLNVVSEKISHVQAQEAIVVSIFWIWGSKKYINNELIPQGYPNFFNGVLSKDVANSIINVTLCTVYETNFVSYILHFSPSFKRCAIPMLR